MQGEVLHAYEADGLAGIAVSKTKMKTRTGAISTGHVVIMIMRARKGAIWHVWCLAKTGIEGSLFGSAVFTI